MTGNERREKVLRSIFYPGAFSQDTNKKAAKRKSLRLKKESWSMEEKRFHLKSFAVCVCGGGRPLYRSYFFHDLFIACPFKVAQLYILQ